MADAAGNRDTVVVIAAYNEGRVVADVVAAVTSAEYRVVVIDDGSQDDTAARAQKAGAVVLRHACNLGQGAALQTGFDYSVRQPGVRHVVTFDADGQHQPREIARLLAPLRAGTHDVALGSRFAGAAPNMPPLKRLTLAVGVLFTRLTTRLQVSDTHNGLRAFTTSAAARLALTQNRMAHASEILSQIAAQGLRWTEVPVTVNYTPYSVRKGQATLDAISILWDIATARMR